MNFTIIDTSWGGVLGDAVKLAEPELRIICPFIKHATARRILAQLCTAPLIVGVGNEQRVKNPLRTLDGHP